MISGLLSLLLSVTPAVVLIFLPFSQKVTAITGRFSLPKALWNFLYHKTLLSSKRCRSCAKVLSIEVRQAPVSTLALMVISLSLYPLTLTLSKISTVFESVRVKGYNDKEITIKAKVDTGAWRTSIDKTLAQDLHLLDESNVLWYRKFHSAFGREKRPVIAVTFWLKGKKIRTTAGGTG